VTGDEVGPRLDAVGAFIANLHQMIGHRAAARFMGQPVGDMKACVLCRYERGEATREQVIERIGVS
jgi:hypothetical protein